MDTSPDLASQRVVDAIRTAFAEEATIVDDILLRDGYGEDESP